MITDNLLVIEKLVLNIPDSVTGSGFDGQVTINDALEYFLQHRTTVAGHMENEIGNYSFSAGILPQGCTPENTATFTSSNLLNKLSEREGEISHMGLMAMMRYDHDLQAYVNSYDSTEQERFLKMKHDYIASKKASEPDDTSVIQEAHLPSSPCDTCEDGICDEPACPDYVPRDEDIE